MSNGALDEPGSAARFFYCAKAGKKERNASGENNHPTVKPIKLMTYLIRLVTPPGGTTLDPFMGSGSTGVAAVENGFDFIGIERGGLLCNRRAANSLTMMHVQTAGPAMVSRSIRTNTRSVLYVTHGLQEMVQNNHPNATRL